MPRVSVLMPTQNQQRFRPRAMESLSAQCLTDWELIVIDDGSTPARDAMVAACSAPWVAVQPSRNACRNVRRCGPPAPHRQTRDGK